jgi:hypothetical protein
VDVTGEGLGAEQDRVVAPCVGFDRVKKPVRSGGGVRIEAHQGVGQAMMGVAPTSQVWLAVGVEEPLFVQLLAVLAENGLDAGRAGLVSAGMEQHPRRALPCPHPSLASSE